MSLENPIIQKVNRRREGRYFSIHVPNKLISKLRLDTSNNSPNYCKIYYDPQNKQLIFQKLELDLGDKKN